MTTAEASEARREAGHSVSASIRTWVLVTLVAFLLSLVAYGGFMTAGGIWFTISDALGLALAGSMIPVMIGFDSLLRPAHGDTSRVAKWIGVCGMALAGVGSIVLLTSEVSHEFLPAGGGLGMQFVGFGLEGVWFMMLGYMASRGQVFGKRFVWTAYAAGLGFAVSAFGASLGPDSTVVMTGATVSLIAFISWAILTRRELETT